MATFELEAFRRKYGATAFDEDSRLDMMAERARQYVIGAFLAAGKDEHPQTGEESQYMAGGMLIGVACIMAATLPQTDEAHAAIRASIIQIAPWAVDMMRQIGDDPLPPLSDGN